MFYVFSPLASPASETSLRKSNQAGLGPESKRRRCLTALLFAALCASPAAAAADDTAPPFGSWSVQEIEGEPTDLRLSLDLTNENMVSGSSGCNRYTGSAQVEGERLELGDLASTRMLCPEEVMKVEERFLSAVEKVQAWQSSPEGVQLIDAEGETLLQLVAAAQPGASIIIPVPDAAAVATTVASFNCNGSSVEVEYANAGSVSLALLTIDSEFVVAANVIAASGARYAGGRFIWWTRGVNEASLYEFAVGEEGTVTSCEAVP